MKVMIVKTIPKVNQLFPKNRWKVIVKNIVIKKVLIRLIPNRMVSVFVTAKVRRVIMPAEDEKSKEKIRQSR